METLILGRTGLEVSVAGLGCGGHSRLGQSRGASEAESIAVVERALDLGVTFIDTARAYRTEEIVGKAIAGRRDEVVLSTKAFWSTRDRALSSPADLRASVELSLRRLGTDHVEVFHLHGVSPSAYRDCVDVFVPEMLALRDEGKIGHLAISEGFGGDAGHEMLQAAVKDDCWDVMMVGFNLLNPSARRRVFETTIAKDIGVLVMFAVRRALSQATELARVVGDLIATGEVDGSLVSGPSAPLGFLVESGAARSVVEAAYRFTRHEPGTHVVLTGTGSVAHLEENVRSISGPPLPPEALARLEALFGKVDSVSGN